MFQLEDPFICITWGSVRQKFHQGPFQKAIRQCILWILKVHKCFWPNNSISWNLVIRRFHTYLWRPIRKKNLLSLYSHEKMIKGWRLRTVRLYVSPDCYKDELSRVQTTKLPWCTVMKTTQVTDKQMWSDPAYTIRKSISMYSTIQFM